MGKSEAVATPMPGWIRCIAGAQIKPPTWVEIRPDGRVYPREDIKGACGFANTPADRGDEIVIQMQGAVNWDAKK